MNLKEGLRRIGAVVGWAAFLAGGLSYGFDVPSRESIDYTYKNKLTASIYAEQSLEYRNNNSEYRMVDAIWPDTTKEKIIEAACTKSATPERLAICSERKEKIKYLWFSWVKHILSSLGVAFLCAAIVGLLWWAFSWVLLGFTQPKDPQPRS